MWYIPVHCCQSNYLLSLDACNLDHDHEAILLAAGVVPLSEVILMNPDALYECFEVVAMCLPDVDIDMSARQSPLAFSRLLVIPGNDMEAISELLELFDILLYCPIEYEHERAAAENMTLTTTSHTHSNSFRH